MVNTPCGYAHEPGKDCPYCRRLGIGGTGRKSPEDIGRASEEKACKTAANTGPSELPVSGGSSGEGASRRKTANHRPRPEGEDTAKASAMVADTREVGDSHAEQSAGTQALKMDQARTPRFKGAEANEGSSADYGDEEPAAGGIQSTVARQQKVGSPLTNAERQKRYRERLGDKYREQNRERMRRSRSKQPSS